MRTIAQTAVDNEKYFGDLDAVVGDGDFGYSLARGFEKVLDDWDDIDRTDIGTFLKKVAVIITCRIGGTSGPIWGTAFLRAGSDGRPARPTLDGDDVVAMLRAAVEGIKAARPGRARRQDPAGRAGPGHRRARARAATPAARRRRGARRRRRPPPGRRPRRPSDMVAKRGRAAYTGERSIGSVDAGAMAVAVIVERISAGWAAAESEEDGA